LENLKEIRIYNIDPELHKDFKAACAAYGLSMRQLLINRMMDFVTSWEKYMERERPSDLRVHKGQFKTWLDSLGISDEAN